MPTALLKAYAKEARVSIEVAEKCWDKAKNSADNIYSNKEKDGKYWAMVNTSTRMCLHLPKHPPAKKPKDSKK